MVKLVNTIYLMASGRSKNQVLLFLACYCILLFDMITVQERVLYGQ